MNHSIIDLFAIPLYRSKINPIDAITYNKLISFEWENPGYIGIDPTHKETAERHILDLPAFSSFRKNVQEHINFYVYEVLGVSKEQTWEITTSWVNKAEHGNYHANHWHSNSMVSGVIYLHTTNETGAICFHKDRSHKNLWGDGICVDFDKNTNYNVEAIGINPNTNDILMFPSILNHSVLENMSNTNRYSLAFNVFPRGVVGKGGNSELIL